MYHINGTYFISQYEKDELEKQEIELKNNSLIRREGLMYLKNLVLKYKLKILIHPELSGIGYFVKLPNHVVYQYNPLTKEFTLVDYPTKLELITDPIKYIDTHIKLY